jgi:uncharacterized damage-inducible protein DinB
MTAPEAWLRGPIDGIDTTLQPAAFALVQAREDIAAAAAGLSPEELQARPGGAASVGFHLLHVAGSIDRLLTYARGGRLSPEQREQLAAEGGPLDPRATADALVARALAAIDRALVALRGADPVTLHDARTIGRAALPSSVFGVLFHIAEHTQRHTGQIITTAKIVRAGGA